MGKKRYGRESLLPNLFLLSGTCDPVVFTSERSVCSAVNDICCWPIFEAVKVLFNQPINGVLTKQPGVKLKSDRLMGGLEEVKLLKKRYQARRTAQSNL